MVPKGCGLVFFCVFLHTAAGASIKVLVDDVIENCSTTETEAGFYSLDNLEIVIESDTDIFINGTIDFFKNVQTPWKARFYSEKYDRDQWLPAMLDTKVADFCTRIHNPKDFWYNQLKHVKGCPIKAGVN